MRNILLVLAICIVNTTILNAQNEPVQQKTPVQISLGPKNDPTEASTVDKIAVRAKSIQTKIKLEESKSQSLFNVINQTEKRIEDLNIETEDYPKLLGYIHQERQDMLKAMLTPAQFKDYEKYFGRRDISELNKLVNKSRTTVARKKALEEREKKQIDALMKKEKDKQIQLEQREKDKAKQELAKQKATEKRELDKQKVAMQREADKLKAIAKSEADKLKAEGKKEKDRIEREADKLKAAAKREADKLKAEEKKEKDRIKREATKQKEADKREAARAKRMK